MFPKEETRKRNRNRGNSIRDRVSEFYYNTGKKGLVTTRIPNEEIQNYYKGESK